MPEQLYLIKWYQKDKPEEIKGGEAPVTKQIGKAWVNEMNSKYPSIIHYLEPVTPKSA
jgi:hypothetical protein